MAFDENVSASGRQFIVYYLVDDEERAVTVARIFYGGRDIEGIINYTREHTYLPNDLLLL